MPNENLVTTIEVTDENGNVSTRDIVTYAGLLSKAHEQGLQRIETHIDQMPTRENGMTAICTATVTTGRGVFMDCGDASPDNVRSGAVPHIIRVALTRAKARALRDAVNIGTISLEEFGDYPPPSTTQQRDDTSSTMSGKSTEPSNPKPITEAQKKKLFTLLEKQGATAEDADRYLCDQLGVRRLGDATVSEASALIQRLSRETSTKPKELVN
jgi:hypothetical protein